MVCGRGEIALHGDFPLGFDHFISKIADGKQQPENPIPTTPGFPYALSNVII